MRSEKQFNNLVKALQSTAEIEGPAPFDPERMASLPLPVRRYFERVLPGNYDAIRSVYLRHSGDFRTSVKANWTPIAGEQFLIAGQPGFAWKGTTRWYTAIDSLLQGEGRLEVFLLGRWRLMSRSGPEVLQGELLRWLGESAWFPTNFLPSGKLDWHPVDERTAILHFNGPVAVQYQVRFDEEYLIESMEADRYMTKRDRFPWVGRFKEYREWKGYWVPWKISAAWMLPEGEHEYARFNVETLTYEPSTPL